MNARHFLPKTDKGLFVLFLCVHFAVWSLLPLLSRNLPHDTLEAIVWGKLGSFGTNKHPPLSGWLADAFFTLGFGRDFTLYILCQLCSLVGFVYIYKLAKRFLGMREAALCVVLLEGVKRYAYNSTEFTCNNVCLALWPMAAYHFYKALKEDKLGDWFWLGVAIGLNMLDKYMSAVLFAGMGGALVSTEGGRRALKRPGVWLSGAAALAVFAPHLRWLHETGYFSLDYFVGERLYSENDWGAWGRAFYPLRFLFETALIAAPAIAAFLWLRRGAPKRARPAGPGARDDARFLLLVGLLPMFLFAAIGLFSGNDIKINWGFPLYFALGIMGFYFFGFEVSEKRFRKGLLLGYILMALMASRFDPTAGQSNFDRADFVRQAEAAWDREEPGRPIKYVQGELYYGNTLALYGKDRPTFVLETWGHANPWIDRADLEDSDILELGRGRQEGGGWASFEVRADPYFKEVEPFTVWYRVVKKTPAR